jgi:hypothetical protein
MSDHHVDDPRHHDEDDEHGRFSRGQELEGETAEKEHRGDFAEGQQAGHDTVHDQRGDFAEGQEQLGEEHLAEGGPDYARGQDHHRD